MVSHGAPLLAKLTASAHAGESRHAHSRKQSILFQRLRIWNLYDRKRPTTPRNVSLVDFVNGLPTQYVCVKGFDPDESDVSDDIDLPLSA